MRSGANREAALVDGSGAGRLGLKALELEKTSGWIGWTGGSLFSDMP